MKFVNSEKVNGELAARNFSEKAKKYYYGAEPLELYEYRNGNDEVKYAVKDCDGIHENLDFEQVDEWFCQMQEEIDRLEESEEEE